jgi:hypothetical protein
MKQLKSTGVFCLIIGTDWIFELETTFKTFLVMPVRFALLQKLTFDGKFQICKISGGRMISHSLSLSLAK